MLFKSTKKTLPIKTLNNYLVLMSINEWKNMTEPNIKKYIGFLKDNNIFYENIGITQSDFFEIKDELKINIKDLFKINNEWYNNY